MWHVGVDSMVSFPHHFNHDCDVQVVEVINADAVVIKKADGEVKKFHLSSLRPPRYLLLQCLDYVC